MSLNFSKIGETVATVTGGALNNKTLYLDKEGTEDDYVKSFTKIELPKESLFEQIPRSDFEREVYYITGKSGSGKSFYTTKLLKQIRKKHKDYPIIVFSPLEDDYNGIDNVNRVELNESLITDPINIKELENSICIFDDIEAITDKKIRNSVWSTLDATLKTGRHYNIYTVFISHESCAGKQTKPILTESHSITAFPRHGYDRGVGYLFKEYWGMSTNEINFIKSRNSRWVTFYKHAPSYIIFEHEIYTQPELLKLANDYARKIKIEEQAKNKQELDLILNKSKPITQTKKTNKK